MEHTNNLQQQELEALREQLQEFKTQLEKQEIVNDQLLRQSMKSRMSWIKKYVWFQFALLPVVALLWLFIKYMLHLSWLNYGFMMLMCVVDAVADYRINKMDRHFFAHENLIDAAEKLRQMKIYRQRSLAVMLPLLLLWVVWTAWEFTAGFNLAQMNLEMSGALVGLVIGALIGIPVALIIYYRMQRTNTELIQQIETFTKD